MSQIVEYRFKIDAFTPATLPMWRLADYLIPLATLLGEKEHVHLDRVTEGSAVPVIRIDREAQPKVRRRLQEARNGDGPEDAIRAIETINKKLAEDNASADLIDPDGTKVVPFPGRKQQAQPEYGPFNQEGTLDGVIARIGGETADVDPIPVHLQEGKHLHVCRAHLEVVMRLTPFLLQRDKPIRAHGIGRWFRTANGQWNMRGFAIHDFKALRKTTLAETVKRLSSIPPNWDVANLDILRRDDTSSSES